MEYRPIIFAISPTIQEDDYRFSELINSGSKDYRAKSGLGIYDCRDRQTLNDALQYFGDKNKEYQGPLVIVVNTHGTEGTGEFEDLVKGERVTVKPQDLWKDLKRPVQDYLRRCGGRKVYICMAQCYGGTFADNLEALILAENDPATNGTTVVGLRYGCTCSEWNLNPHATIGNEARHVELEDWMKSMFEKAVDPGNATQGAGMGARTQLAANRPPPAQRP